MVRLHAASMPSTNDGRRRGNATWFFGRQLLANIHGDGRFELAVLWCRWFFKPRYPRLAAARKGLWTVIKLTFRFTGLVQTTET